MTDPQREQREQRSDMAADMTLPSRPGSVMKVIGWAEESVYIVVGLMLAIAGVFVIVGTATSLIDNMRKHEDAVQLGLLILDRILLLLIIAELLHTLRLVLYEGEIFAEPFLLIGLIAVVRRVVVVTAKVEQLPGAGREVTNFLLELGILAGLALAFGAAIFLLRRGGTQRQQAA